MVLAFNNSIIPLIKLVYHKVEIEIEETLYITSEDEGDEEDDVSSLIKQNAILKKMKTKLG